MFQGVVFVHVQLRPHGGGGPGGGSLGERLAHPEVTGLLADCLGCLEHEGLLFFEPPWPAVIRRPSGEFHLVGPSDSAWELLARRAYNENGLHETREPLRHLLAVPVQVGQAVGGALCLSTVEAPDGLIRSLIVAVSRSLGEMENRRRLDHRRRQVLSGEQVARVEAETNERRLAFLYQATGALLSTPLDTEARLAALARLCVPDFADWCLVDVLRDGHPHRLEVAHWNPAGVELAASLKGKLQLPAMGWGKTELVEDVTLRRGEIGESLDTELFRRLGARSAIVLPLRTADIPLGSVTFVFSESNRRYDARDLALLSDLGQRAALAAGNARLLQEAKTAVRARDETLAIVSHDLRNPLAAILANAGLLEKRLQGDEGERLRQRAQAIRRSANRMNHMIRDLLDLARIEAGGLELAPEPQPVGPLLADALEMFLPLAAEKGLDLAVEPDLEGQGLSAGATPQIVIDRERILQVLSNLLGNALKFTPSGGTIRVKPRMEDGLFSIGVLDDGCGIVPGALPRLFDRYWQGRPEERRQGAGLGLYIARGIVEAHGGRIWALSEPGKGSAFWFTLPWQAPSADE